MGSSVLTLALRSFFREILWRALHEAFMQFLRGEDSIGVVPIGGGCELQRVSVESPNEPEVRGVGVGGRFEVWGGGGPGPTGAEVYGLAPCSEGMPGLLAAKAAVGDVEEVASFDGVAEGVFQLMDRDGAGGDEVDDAVDEFGAEAGLPDFADDGGAKFGASGVLRGLDGLDGIGGVADAAMRLVGVDDGQDSLVDELRDHLDGEVVSVLTDGVERGVQGLEGFSELGWREVETSHAGWNLP